jgi:hypothetical protein
MSPSAEMAMADQTRVVQRDSLEVFLDEFPSVSREQAIAALELAREVIAPDAHTA